MTEPLDLPAIRHQFPALDDDWALLDNAGGSAPARPVIDRIHEFLQRWPVQLGASYAHSQEAATRVEAGRQAMARWIHADPDEVILGASSTVLVQLLARSLAARG